MDKETPEQRKTRLARLRKQAQRDREHAHRAKVAAQEFRLEMYAGTRAELARICWAGQFEEPAEAITLLIHNAAELIERDPSRFAEMLRARSHA
ncbi:hypothetical protein D3C78_1085270 [compost metagenome]